GWRIGKLHRRLRKQAAVAHLPTMHTERLASAYLYYDAAVDDARLVLTVCRTAAAHGAAVANRCSFAGVVRADDGSVAGAKVVADGREFTVDARTVVNAAGVWADDVQHLAEGVHPDSIRPAKGVHLTVPWEKVQCDIAVVIPVPKDRRSLFLVPWGPRADGTFEYAYIGTTDTDYDGPVDDPQCTKDDIDYVLRAVNASLRTGVTEHDVIGVWSGLRPLVKRADSGRTADLSRTHSLRESNGVFTITGGKLTTYREMAEDTVDAVAARLGSRAKCRTKRLRLLGATRRHGADGSPQAHLAGRYGSLADEVRALVATDPSLGEPVVAGLPTLRAEVVYAARHEMASTVDDVLTRRTRARLFDRAAAMRAAPAVAALLAEQLGWSPEERQRQVDHFLAECEREITAGATA
ncbi:MAG: FAD-dependent oxidoreductase, partial [Acidobacteria bacterium]|nr:FAD-dependent oxidoreductase [Acidobacteriota bacterium]